MQNFDQIIVGAGASGLTFLHSALQGTQQKFVRKKTLVVGKGADQLWARIGGQNPTHAMGQPASLLRPSGLPVPPNGVPMRTMTGGVDFLKTDQFNGMLGDLSQKINTDRAAMDLPALCRVEDNVVSITTNSSQGYIVSTTSDQNDFKTRNFAARQVIVACGPGLKSSSLESVKVKINGNLRAAAESGEYLDAVDYISSQQDSQRIVLIYGGSATASWAAAHAYASGALAIGWAARRGTAQIKTEGNPIGRNEEIIAKAESRGWIIEDEITEVTFHADRPEFRGRLEVKFKKGFENGDSLVVDQLVYALGADPMAEFGPGFILSQDIRRRIEPVWDNCYRFVKQTDSGTQNKVAIALKDRQGDLWVVGASVFRGLGIDAVKSIIETGDKSKYALAGSILPAGGRPPEGIAILDATIRAVTGYRQTDDATFNWSTATRRDIFMLLARTYAMEIPYTTRENMADEIVEERASTQTGFTIEYLFAFLDMLKRDHYLNIDLKKLPGNQGFSRISDASAAFAQTPASGEGLKARSVSAEPSAQAA